ncbi:MAG: hypothetical protein Q8N54_11780 [Sulfurimicrobium sp.]|jgi:hypothetical protein|nr:hypothetical protein [Sulfurimicrobium sp.]MDO9190436.1 hypothetical protein [Sulfurimicrobium sp.]MDP1705138.1 hypothetical protein [Sulfurimicrobium sp.]MDP2197413.1 hypothetical protein [Sulfurimicrobium sp.]MDP2963430.1 hypothetical protein [Sulfurimicrobium sp.]
MMPNDAVEKPQSEQAVQIETDFFSNQTVVIILDPLFFQTRPWANWIVCAGKPKSHEIASISHSS